MPTEANPFFLSSYHSPGSPAGSSQEGPLLHGPKGCVDPHDHAGRVLSEPAWILWVGQSPWAEPRPQQCQHKGEPPFIVHGLLSTCTSIFTLQVPQLSGGAIGIKSTLPDSRPELCPQPRAGSQPVKCIFLLVQRSSDARGIRDRPTMETRRPPLPLAQLPGKKEQLIYGHRPALSSAPGRSR